MGAKTADIFAPSQAAAPVAAPLDPELAEALKAAPLAQFDPNIAPESQPAGAPGTPLGGAAVAIEPQPTKDGFSVKTANLFFGSSSLGAPMETMEHWQPGEEPSIVLPPGALLPSITLDPDMKVTASLPAIAVEPGKIGDKTGDKGGEAGGESIAGKGEVNSANQRIKTPAERLGLFDTKQRARQEKCLADAVYFEARGEAVRGQIAVAQVVMNRVFSGFYPNTPCAVVYQNSHRHLACQFTFACDGIADVVKEPDMWDRARKIAKETLDGRLWLPEVAKSTHYHAYWVRPSWVHEMKKMYRFGVHTFYRPRAWGDGSEAEGAALCTGGRAGED